MDTTIAMDIVITMDTTIAMDTAIAMDTTMDTQDWPFPLLSSCLSASPTVS